MEFAPFLGVHKDRDEILELIAGFSADARIVRDDDAFCWYCELPDHGLSLVFGDDGGLLTVFFLAEGIDDASEYEGELPEGLEFSLGRSQIRKRLGNPSRSTDAEVFLGQQLAASDRYDRETHFLQVSYASDLKSVTRAVIQRHVAGDDESEG